jgi:hypothetical protein
MMLLAATYGCRSVVAGKSAEPEFKAPTRVL